MTKIAFTDRCLSRWKMLKCQRELKWTLCGVCLENCCLLWSFELMIIHFLCLIDEHFRCCLLIKSLKSLHMQPLPGSQGEVNTPDLSPVTRLFSVEDKIETQMLFNTDASVSSAIHLTFTLQPTRFPHRSTTCSLLADKYQRTFVCTCAANVIVLKVDISQSGASLLCRFLLSFYENWRLDGWME